MAAEPVTTLPPGFTLDPQSSALPAGFQLDRPEEPTLLKKALALAATGMRGFATGGPMGLSAAMGAEGLKQANALVDKAAYGIGGKVTDIASQAGASPEVAGGAGFVANVATQAVPTVLGGEVAKFLSAAKSAATWLMHSALKPSSKALAHGFGGAPSQADRAVQTLLDEGINISESGVAKLQEKVAQGKEAINTAITTAANNPSTPTIDKAAVAGRLKDVIARFEKQPLPEADLKTINDAYAKFMSGSLPDQIPVIQAQAIKEGGGTLLKRKYGQLGAADVEVEKALVRGFKEEIAKAVPGIDKLNERESNLINALLLADRRAGISGNKDLAGIAWLAHNPEVAAVMMLDRSSVFKSVMARILNANSRTLPGAVGSGGVGIYEASTQRQ